MCANAYNLYVCLCVCVCYDLSLNVAGYPLELTRGAGFRPSVPARQKRFVNLSHSDRWGKGRKHEVLLNLHQFRRLEQLESDRLSEARRC